MRRWPLLVILLLQAGLSLSLLSRPVVLDETTYIDAGQAEVAHWVHGSGILPYSQIFSGAPVIYPPLSSTAASVGGLAAARLLSLCFMLAATALLHFTARELVGASAAIVAALLFATTSAVQYLGALATFDALALMLLAAAAWSAVRSAEAAGRRRLILLGLMCGLLAAANAAKYASALWDPVVVAMAALADARRRNWRKGLETGLVSAVGTLALVATALMAGPSYWKGILFSTVNRTANNGIPAFTILESAGRWVGLVAILAVAGAIELTRSARERPMKAMGWVLAAAVFLAPAEQARIGVAMSLFKHVGFGAWFAAIPAGYGVLTALSVLSARAVATPRWAKFISGLVAVVFVAAAAIGIYEADETNGVPAPYPISVMASLQRILKNSGPWLADMPNVIIYYTHTSPLRWRSTYGLTYTDPATSRKLSGIAAYVDAIRHDYFSAVVLRASRARAPVDQAVLTALRHNRNYHLTVFRAHRSSVSNRPPQTVLIWRRMPK